MHFARYFTRAGLQNIVMSIGLCLFVRLSVHSHKSKSRSRTSPNFCACCLWLGPAQTTLRYVMDFRFYGWRDVFIPWVQWADGFRQNKAAGHTYKFDSAEAANTECNVRQLQLFGRVHLNAAPRDKVCYLWWPGFCVHCSQCWQCFHSSHFCLELFCCKYRCRFSAVLPTSLVVQVEHSVRCVYVCVSRSVTYQLNDIWSRRLAC